MARNQRAVPGLPVELDGLNPHQLMARFVDLHHFLSDRAWRFFASWTVQAGILDGARWLELFNAAAKDQRPVEEPRKRRRPVVAEG